MYVSNTIDVNGFAYSDIQLEIRQIKVDNIELRRQIAQAMSLTTLSQKAKDLGFIEARTTFYIYAKNENIVSR